MSDTLYQRVKRALKMMAPTTPATIARELDADTEATRLVLEDMKRRGQAINRPNEDGAVMWFVKDKKAQ
ncbi:MAG: hypothetical protein AB7W59_00240 [Acidimicrobiia bacterium]